MKTVSFDGKIPKETLFPNIVFELIVNQRDVMISNINDVKTFNTKFKNYLLFNGFTNVEQVDKYNYKYKFGKAKLNLKEGY